MLGTTTVDHAIVSRGSHLVEEQHRSEVTVALLSVHPEYVDLIKKGGKRVEFRRRPFARTITHIVIYATSPVKKLVGVCEVERVIQDAPAALWARYGWGGGISRDALFRYLDGLMYGIAIVLRSFRSFVNLLDLSALGVERPPQSFRYLNKSVFADLI